MINPFLEKKKEKVDFSEGNKLKAFILVSIFLSFFLINFISAVPPVTTVGQFPTGYDILEAQQQNIKFGEHYTYHLFLYNASNGVNITNDTVVCGLFSSDVNGDLVLSVNLNYNLTAGYWYYNISPTTFPTIGSYSYGVNCQNGGFGGGLAGAFEVSRLGYILDTSHVIGSSIYLILIIFLMFTFGIVGFHLLQNKYLWILGLFLVVLAAFLLVYSSWLGYEYYNYLTGLPASNMPEIIFYIFLFIIGSGLLASLVLLFIHWKKVFKYFKRELKKKESDEDLEDWDFDEWR